MAPPTMFNIFRSNHRRSGSTPSSPQSTSRPALRTTPSQLAFPSSSSLQPTHSESPVSPVPPVLPPIPRIASKHDEDYSQQPSRPTSRRSSHEHNVPQTQTTPERVHARRTSDQSRSPPSAWRPSYSLGLNFDAPLQYSAPRATPAAGRKDHPRTPPNPEDNTPEPWSFTIDPPHPSQTVPTLSDEAPQGALPTASKVSRTYSSLADFGRFDFRRGSKLSIEASGSYRSPPSASRAQLHDPASTQAAAHSSPCSSTTSFHRTSSQQHLPVTDAANPGSNARQSQFNPQPSIAAPAPRLSKARNLLNPVSLLMRRRTSQVDEADIPVAPQRMFEVPALEVPQDYDPRIKGKRVHDFDDDSRKPRRNLSANDMTAMARASQDGKFAARRSSISTSSVSAADALGLPAPDREHTPVFVENFDDDDEALPESSSKAVQRESLANPDFLARASKQFNLDASDLNGPLPAPYDPLDAPKTPPNRSNASTPPTAIKKSNEVTSESRSIVDTNMPAPTNEPLQSSTNPVRTSKNTDTTSLRVSLDQSTARSSFSNDTSATTPPLQKTPPEDASQRSTTLEAPFQPTTSLKHLSSNASRVSRFSFQFNSERSIEQERALEEKHKAKYDAKASKHVSLADSRFDELDDEGFDFDGIEDGGFEEEIPELGGYEEDDGFGKGLADSTLESLAPPLQTVLPTAPSSHYTTRSPTELEPSEPPSASELPVLNDARFPPARTMTRSTVISDDMYYDDGVIGPQVQPGASESEYLDNSRRDSSSATERRLERHSQGIGSVAADQRAAAVSEKATRLSYQEALQESTLRHSTSLNAYHSALAGAAAKAAKDGRFSRGQSVNTASSKYSNSLDDFADGLSPDADDTVFGTQQQQQQSFDDGEEEEDPMIAAANAEVLASDDAEYYGNEFGFYGTSAVSKDGQMYHGGYFGQPEMLRAAMNLRSNEPNLTPITERSEYSTRNSFIGSTPWGPSNSASHANLGLKDLAASLGLDDNDMTLSQLMKLRRAAFEGTGSSPRSIQGSSGSNDSSPTSQPPNSSPLAFRHQSPGHMATNDHRRPSDLELPDVSEAPETEDVNDEMLLAESPISPTVTFGTAQAIPLNKQTRRQSADIYAREYQDFVRETSSKPAQIGTNERRFSAPLTSLPSVPGPSSPPILSQAPAPKSPAASPLATPLLSQFPAVPSSTQTAVPSPSAQVLEKFAQRPAPDAYRKSWEPSQRMSAGGLARERNNDGTSGSTSVAYVRDVGSDGKEKWYLERRRKRSSGDLVVLSREAVKGGI